MTRKETLELILEVANEANGYMPCWNIAMAVRGLLHKIELKECEPSKPKTRRLVLVEGALPGGSSLLNPDESFRIWGDDRYYHIEWREE